jgi:hypothetical protein
MVGLKSLWNRIYKAFRPNMTVEFYSEKTQQWVTISVPGGRRDLIEAERQKFESGEYILPKSKEQKVPVMTARPITAIEECNEWIRNVGFSTYTRFWTVH